MNIKKLLKNQVFANMRWLVSGRILQMAIALVINMITARYLGVNNYGIINYVASYVSFFTPICSLVNQRSIRYSWHEPDVTILEGFLARGDRRCSKVILRAYEKGAIYDAWSESFDYNIWKESFAETNTDIDFYTLRERSTDEILPWDFIDAGVTKKFLIHEWEQAKKETVTPNCRQKCSGCGAMRYGGGVCYEGKN